MPVSSLTTGVGNDTTGTVRVAMPVAGLTCPSCVQALETALREVCGMQADEKKSAGTANHAGKTYFCSAGCKASFEKAPEKYAEK